MLWNAYTCMVCIVYTYIIYLCIRSLIYPPNLPMGQEPTIWPSYRCENHVSDHQRNALKLIRKAVVLKRKAVGGGADTEMQWEEAEVLRGEQVSEQHEKMWK